MLLIFNFKDKFKPKNKINKGNLLIMNEYKKFFYVHKGDWFTNSELQYILQIKGASQVRLVINYLRMEGLPIISSIKGYKYSEDKAELKQYLKSLHYRILTQMSIEHNIKKRIQEL